MSDDWTEHVWESVNGKPRWYQTLYFLFCISECEKCRDNWEQLLSVEEEFQV